MLRWWMAFSGGPPHNYPTLTGGPNVGINDLLDLLDTWVRSRPTVRGHAVEDAEVRLNRDGRGRLAVSFGPDDPEDTSRTLAGLLAEGAETTVGKAGRRAVTPPVPLALPVLAFADFASLGEAGRVLRAESRADFYFDAERPETGDPLRDR